MSYVLTLVNKTGNGPIQKEIVDGLKKQIDGRNLTLTSEPAYSSDRMAVDLGLEPCPDADFMRVIRAFLRGYETDSFIQPIDRRQKRLFLADMESTVIPQEALDELADYAGVQDRVADITHRTMNGELDFESSLRERVGLLDGLDAGLLEKIRDGLSLNPGIAECVKTLKSKGVICVLVSGGFTVFTQHIAKMAGFHFHHGNVLEVDRGKITGRVKDPVLDRQAKLCFLKEYALKLNISLDETMTIGDGANDLAMLEAAGLGVAYYPKPILGESIQSQILYGDFTALLYAQGYSRSL